MFHMHHLLKQVHRFSAQVHRDESLNMNFLFIELLHKSHITLTIMLIFRWNSAINVWYLFLSTNNYFNVYFWMFPESPRKSTLNLFTLDNLHRESVLHERFSALHVFITQSNIKHDQLLFFTLTEPTTNKNDFHHHIDLDSGSIISRFVSVKTSYIILKLWRYTFVKVCKYVCDF